MLMHLLQRHSLSRQPCARDDVLWSDALHIAALLSVSILKTLIPMRLRTFGSAKHVTSRM